MERDNLAIPRLETYTKSLNSASSSLHTFDDIHS